MTKLLFNILTISIVLTSLSGFSEGYKNQNHIKSELQYVGMNSSQAILRFDYFVDLTADDELSDEQARILIDRQLTHLIGSLSYIKTPAAPYGREKIKLLKTEKTESGFRIHYSYEGMITVFDRATEEITFPLPRDPFKIYRQSLVYVDGKPQYPCADDEHYQEQYFWYFWAPQMEGCKLQAGVHFDWVVGQLEHLSNTQETTPEYDRLVNDNNEIQIDVIFGMDNEGESYNVHTSKDFLAGMYLELRNELVNKHLFSARTWSSEEIRQLLPNASNYRVTIETLQKLTPRGLLKIRFFFGGTSLGSSYAQKATPFQYFFKDSLEHSSVMIYNGHSGLGQYLDLEKIESKMDEPIHFNRNKYQIYFFNACSTYPYYNSQYFEPKGGSKNLDIITNGLSTFLMVMPNAASNLIEMIDDWAMTGTKRTYSSFLKKADSLNLLGVNGDEDNSTTQELK